MGFQNGNGRLPWQSPSSRLYRQLSNYNIRIGGGKSWFPVGCHSLLVESCDNLSSELSFTKAMLGVYISPSFSTTRALRGLYYQASNYRRKARDCNAIVFASGLVLGESLASLLNVVLTALRAPKLRPKRQASTRRIAPSNICFCQRLSPLG